MGYVGATPAAKALTSADITDGIIIDADIKSDAAIAMSKTALSAGTGLTLSTNTLNVDASQGGVTTVGALNAGSITSGFTSIDVGSGGLTTTGAIAGGTIDATTDFTIGSTVITDDVITFTPTSSDTVTMTAAANGVFSLVTVDAAAAAANIVITADGTVDVNSAGVLTLDSGAAINIEPAAGSAILLDGTISIDGGVVTGATSITSTAFVGDITGDVTGTADTATVATTVTITDNESTSETNAVIFTAGADLDGGNLGLESDGDFTYTPNSGTVAATTFSGALSGNATTATALATGRTIAMTGDVAWTSASFTGSGNVTGAGTIQANAVEGSMLNNNTISGQTEITSGLVAADELLYDDGGVIKKIGLDNFVELTPALATEDAVADGDYFLFLDGGASGNMNKEAVHDLATLFAGAGMTATSSVVNVIGGDGITANANDVAITAAQTTVTSVYNTSLKMGRDSQNLIDFATTDNKIILRVNNVDEVELVENALSPVTASGVDLGTASLEWGNIYIGDDKKIYLGTGSDASIEYDEDGTDQLRISGATVFDSDMEIADSKFVEFASAAGTPTTDNKVQGIVIEFLAVEAITQFDAVYVSTTTGRVGRADANDAAKMPVIGIAIEAQGSAGSSVRVLTHGVYRDDGGFGGNMTVGVDLYAPETPGTLTTTIPADDGDLIQVIGVATGVRSAFINPSLDVIEHA